MRLDGKVAIVTGGAHGMGEAEARLFAKEGAKVVVADILGDRAEAVAASIRASNGAAIAAAIDVTSEPAWVALIAKTVETYGRLDILVNNAGIGGFSTPLHQLLVEDWDRILNTNLRGVFYMIHALAPLMIKGKSGHIINISSLAGKNALPNGAAYAASKWGLNGLSYSVAEELRSHNIRVAVICPGSTNTELSPHEGKSASRMLQPDDVAHVVEMLVTQAPQSFASEVLLRPTLKP